MSATVDFYFVQATISDDTGRWTCEDKEFEAVLNEMLPRDGASGADPNPALTYATLAADTYGGEVIRFDTTTEDEIEPPTKTTVTRSKGLGK